MSSNLYWEPTKRMLRGLAAAGVEGADGLIDAIEKHDSIELTEEF